MGLRMDSNIHQPSVPSSTQSKAESNGTAPLIELIKKKDSLEEELNALADILRSHGVNMNTSLTTFDGFPRDDIDVAQIRTTRARIIHLKNDHKALMSQIETGLHEHHAAYQKSLATGATASPNAISSLPSHDQTQRAASSRDREELAIESPFARVNSVIAESPADEAGVEAGDEITRFGDVHFLNHERLSKVAQVVQQNLGKNISMKVQREDTAGNRTTHRLELTPRTNWGGRGALGCHILPID